MDDRYAKGGYGREGQKGGKARNNAKPGYGSSERRDNAYGGARSGYGDKKPGYGSGERRDNAYGGARSGYGDKKPGYGSGERRENAYGGARSGYGDKKPGYGSGEHKENAYGGARSGYGGKKFGYGGERGDGGYRNGKTGFSGPGADTDTVRSSGRKQKPYEYKRTAGDQPVTHSAKPANQEFKRREDFFDHQRAGGDRPVFHSAKTDNKPARQREFGPSRFESKPYDRKPEQRRSYYKSEDTEQRAYSVKAPAQEQAQVQQQGEIPYFIMGRNAVREAIKSGRSIDRILVLAEQDGSLREVVGLARDRRLVIKEVSKAKLDEMCMPFGYGGRPGNHQGIIALVPDVEYAEINDLLAVAAEKGEPPFIIVLDGIEDTHNMGSIIRSAECAGAHGVIIPKRRSASVTAAVAKESSGAVEYIKIAKVTNITNTLNDLKKAGLWIVGAVMNETPMDKAKLSGPIALVIGSEGSGISRLAQEACDMLVSIPLLGKIDSLNASVAAAVLMFEKKRQDGFSKQ